jgi:hypothetical protein
MKKRFKAVYSIQKQNEKSELMEQNFECMTDLDVQKQLCREHMSTDKENPTMVRVVSINEVDAQGREMIKEGNSGLDNF